MKGEIARQFGRNLVRERRRADLSQEEVGFLACLHRTEIGVLERGVRLPRIDTVIKLAGALEAEPGELLAGMRWRPGGPRAGAFAIEESQREENES